MLFSCDSDENVSQPTFDGTYIGIFERNQVISNVTINLGNGIFSGTSETEKFPAICNGNYAISGNLIQFGNDCAWTADFDWSLILTDSWNYTFENSTLTLTNGLGDKYILMQQ
jgi:hypothetical protein